VLLAAGHILGPVAGVGLLVVEEAAYAELLGRRPVPAGPVAGAGRLVPEYPVQPVTMLRALWWVWGGEHGHNLHQHRLLAIFTIYKTTATIFTIC
jgi:hypothetical protein